MNATPPSASAGVTHVFEPAPEPVGVLTPLLDIPSTAMPPHQPQPQTAAPLQPLQPLKPLQPIPDAPAPSSPVSRITNAPSGRPAAQIHPSTLGGGLYNFDGYQGP